jgi:acetyl esterase/lipase
MFSRRRRLVMLLVCVSAALASGCRSTEFALANAPTQFSHIDRHVGLAYGADPRQQLDVYVPRGTGQNRPVVIFWYGGSWVGGNKAEYRFVGSTLAQQGFVAILPDYRLYPQVRFPSFDEDGARAVAWVEHHAAEFNGDPNHIILMGHSAGAHTAAFLAYNHRFLESFGARAECIVGVVGLSGPYALVPDTDLLRAAFPAPYQEADWQPIAFVDRDSPPTLLLHGESDKQVLPLQATELRDVLQQHDVPVDLILYSGRGHVSTVASFAWITRWTTPAVRDTTAFIKRVSAGRGRADAR